MTNPLAGLTGNIETACIIVRDQRSKADVKTSSGGGILGATASALSAGSALASALTGPPDKTFKVQFNPSELLIDARTYAVHKSDARADKKRKVRRSVSDSVLKPTVELTVKLIFDQVNIYDSFMFDKFSGGISAQGVKNVASAIAGIFGKVWTVQKEVEGFIAALRNPYTRNVTFAWSTFSFTGKLKNIAAQYTMFSVSGRPVRAKVTMRISQEMNQKTLADWYADFEKAFSGDTSNLVTFGQQVGNLFNVNL